MTQKTLETIFEELSNHYPSMFKTKNAQMAAQFAAEWLAVFKDYQDDEVLKAVAQYILENHFAPTIPDIKGKIDRARRIGKGDAPRLETARPLEVLTMERLEEEMKWVAVCEFQPISTDKKQVYDKFVELYGFKYDFGPILARVGDPWEGVEL